MNTTFFNGVSGLIAYQNDLNALSHNMANVNTTGYKGTRTTFKDLLYTEMDLNTNRPLAGHGVRVASLDLTFGQGTPRSTGNPKDLAIVGDGFFAVERGDHIEYTRNGSFQISVQGKNGYLVAGDGGFILDAKGKRIKLERKGEGGNVFDLTDLPQRVGIYRIPNPYGLARTEMSSFVETETSGEAVALRPNRDEMPEIIQSAVESSNVELPDQMADLIVTQRAYQMSAKMVQTADQIEEIVNNLR